MLNQTEMSRLLAATARAKALALDLDLELDSDQASACIKHIVSGIDPLFALAASGIAMPSGWVKLGLGIKHSQALERIWINATEKQVKALLSSLAESNVYPVEVDLHSVVLIWHRSETNRDIASKFYRTGKWHYRIAAYVPKALDSVSEAKTVR